MSAMRIWTGVTVLLIGGILALGWFLGVSPLLTQASAADAERAVVEQTNVAQAAALQVLKAKYENIDELRDQLQELRASVPSEVDTDIIYALISSYQAKTGAVPSLITVGEALQFGIPAANQEETTASPGPASGQAPTGALAENLYTVTVTITFANTPLSQVLAFASELQNGPRLFLVTSVQTAADSASITAYMFVIHDGAVSDVVADPEDVVPTPTPTPTGTATPGPTGGATPTPTPTGTPAP